MLPDRVSNPGPLTYESGVLPIALRGPALGFTTEACLCYKLNFAFGSCELNKECAPQLLVTVTQNYSNNIKRIIQLNLPYIWIILRNISKTSKITACRASKEIQTL